MTTRNRRTNLQIEVDTLREASKIMRAYGVPASANVLQVVSDAIENGTRTKKT
jgi:hypothetical protein